MSSTMDLIMETCASVPKVPLKAAPLPEFDLGVSNTCPLCSSLNTLTTQLENCAVSVCHECLAEFTPQPKPQSRAVIERLAVRRSKRLEAINRFSQFNQ